MLTYFIRRSFRRFCKQRTGTAIHLLGLTLGLSTCLAIYLITDYEFGFDRFHPDGDRIYRVVGRMQYDAKTDESKIGFVPYALPLSMREEISGLEHLAAFINFETSVIVPEQGKPDKRFEQRDMETQPAEIVLAEPEYFRIFRYEWLAGDSRTALAAPYQVVLTEKKARKYFGDLAPDECIGRTLVYSDSLRMSVSGIVRDWADPSDLCFQDFLSYATISNSFLKNWTDLTQWNDVWSASQAFVKLEESTLLSRVESQFPAFAKAHASGEFIFTPALQPLSDLHFNADYQDNYSRKAHLPTLYGLTGIAAFILLLAVINFINLSTAQAFRRAAEVGVRKAMGSTRSDLMASFLGETALLTGGAILLSLVITPQAFEHLTSILPPGLKFQMNARVLIFLSLTGLATILLAGIYPAFSLSAFAPTQTLKGQTTPASGERGYLRKSLIVFQFVVSVVFILGAVLVNRQIAFMRHKDLGFQPGAVLMLNRPMGPENKLPEIVPQIRESAGVQKTAMQMFEPMGRNFGLDVVTYRGKTEQTMEVSYKMGDENFIPFYEMKLLAGRNLLKSPEPSEMVVNESMVRAMGLKSAEEAIGKELIWLEIPYPIVGVVADFHQQSMHEKIPPTFITTIPGTGNLIVKLNTRTTAETEATIARIATLWAGIYPKNKMEYRFLDDEIARFYEKEHKTSHIVNLATLIAILISCLGLYGLSLFEASRRTKEIGIRKVLGASVAGITGLLAKDFLKLVIAAIAIASPVAYFFMDKWLADFAYRIDIQWWMFALAGAAAVAVAVLTVGLQSVKAALVNPVKSLRSE